MTRGKPCLVALFLIAFVGSAIAEEPEKKKTGKLELSKEEQTVLELTNKEREKEKLPALKPNKLLFEAARAHTANMAKKGEMNHELDGKNPSQRVKAVGYDYAWVGENIAAGEQWSLPGLMEAWMKSDHHRENILKEQYDEIGIGAVKGSDGKIYYTQVFGAQKRRK